MKLSIVFPVLNQFPLSALAINQAVSNLSGQNDVELVVLDNGSDTDMSFLDIEFDARKLKVVRLSKNVGVYPTFWVGLRYATGDVLAFFHSDLIISERNWDMRVVEAFDSSPNLGLLGFIGSNEIDGAGGRGLGTTSNFQGIKYEDKWVGSPAEVHGQRNSSITLASVVDGCAMIFRRSVLEAILQRANFPPHHFYDKLLSCEVREKGFKMATLGIGCDHISGQTVAHETKYEDMAQVWCEAHGIAKTHNWDDAVYHEAERQWLNEYRDVKHLIPCKV